MTDAAPPASRRPSPLARIETVSALGVVAVLALMLGLLAVTRPVETAAERSLPYEQLAAFTYSADTAEDSFYGAGGLEPGETVVLDEVEDLRVEVAYALRSQAEVDVTGRARLTAVVAVAGGLRRTFRIANSALDGGDDVVGGVLPLDAMRTYLARSRSLLGPAAVASTATVTLTPEIEARGTIGGRDVQITYAPTLDLVLTDDTLAVTTDEVEPVAADSTVLNPSEPGEVGYDEVVPATLPLLVASPRVDHVRWASLAVLLLSLLGAALITRRLVARRGDSTEAERILSMHGSRMVAVSTVDLRDGPVADVAEFDDLLLLARRYESVIMHSADVDTFSLWDNGLTYRYRAASDSLPPSDPD